MNKLQVVLLASCTLLAPALIAQGQDPGKTGAVQTSMPTNARQFKRMKMPGTDVEKNVKRLISELRWYKSLRSALAAGRAKGRPVLWIQALGDLDGFL